MASAYGCVPVGCTAGASSVLAGSGHAPLKPEQLQAPNSCGTIFDMKSTSNLAEMSAEALRAFAAGLLGYPAQKDETIRSSIDQLTLQDRTAYPREVDLSAL